jgi:hypothetical protein
MLSLSSAFPERVLTPTAQTIANPDPDSTRVFPRRKGVGLYMKFDSLTACFSIYSGSPVNELSSTEMSVPEINRQSAGILIP